MGIPKVIHQLWKTDAIPARWQQPARSVKRQHRGWEYRLWTDSNMDLYVQTNHPELYPVYSGFDRHIMRVDVFRYVLMYDFGGLYCDLDYEFVRPFDYADTQVVLSLEYDQSYGDEVDQVANYIFASVPRHELWKDILEDVRLHPPVAPTAPEVCIATGPKLITRVFFRNRERYSGVNLTHQPVLSPRRIHGRRERKFYVNSGITYGFHHGWGSWRERWNLPYFRDKIAKILRLPKTAMKHQDEHSQAH